MQAVGDIGVGCAGIEIEEKQREMRVEIFVTALYSFADNMVRNTAERLQRDHFVDAVIRQVAYLTGQEPALTEVCGGVDDAAALVPDVHDICERAVERVVAAETVIDMCVMEQKTVDELCLPGFQTVLADMLLAVDERVRNRGGEEARDRRRYNFHAVLHEPADDAVVRERVVLDVYLADHTDHRHLFGRVCDVRERARGIPHELADSPVVALRQERLRGVEVVVVEFARHAGNTFTRSGRIIEFGKRVGEIERFERRTDEVQPIDFKARLAVFEARTDGNGYHRHLAHACRHQSVFDERVVVRRTALTACLRDCHSGLREVVLAGFQSPHDRTHHDSSRIADVVVRHVR